MILTDAGKGYPVNNLCLSVTYCDCNLQRLFGANISTLSLLQNFSDYSLKTQFIKCKKWILILWSIWQYCNSPSQLCLSVKQLIKSSFNTAYLIHNST